MTPAMVGTFQLCVSLLIAVAVYSFAWKPLSLEHLRDDLFALRDRLFTKVEELDDPTLFQDPLYRDTRNTINACLYTSGWAWTPVSLFLTMLHIRRRGALKRPEKVTSPDRRIDALCREIDRDVSFRLIRYVVLENIVGLVLGWCYVLVSSFRTGTRILRPSNFLSFLASSNGDRLARAIAEAEQAHDFVRLQRC